MDLFVQGYYEEGVAKLSSLVNIIITDVSMPVLDGLSMASQLKETLPDTAFIFISCFDEFKFIKSAMDGDATAYVLKPIRLDELSLAIKKATDTLDMKLSYIHREASLRYTSNTLISNFLTDLLLNAEYDEEYAQFLNINNDDDYCLALIHLNPSIAPSNETYKSLIRLKDICIDCFETDKNYFLEFGINTLVLLINKSYEHDFSKCLLTIQNRAKIELGTKIKVFKNDIARPLSEIGSAFYILNKNANTDTSLQEISEVNPNTDELYRQLMDILFSNERNHITNFVNNYFFDELRQKTYYTRSLSMQIISTLSIILKENNLNFKDIFDDKFVVWDKVINFDTIKNVKHWMTNILFAIRDYLTDEIATSDKYDTIVSEIKSFINDNYSHLSIVEEVASHVHLSINHANSIFKKATGQTLFSYAVEKRIHHAKLLMRDKNLSISAISHAVGYSSNTYFSTAFKKNTGMSPNQYRSRLLDIN